MAQASPGRGGYPQDMNKLAIAIRLSLFCAIVAWHVQAAEQKKMAAKHSAVIEVQRLLQSKAAALEAELLKTGISMRDSAAGSNQKRFGNN